MGGEVWRGLTMVGVGGTLGFCSFKAVLAVLCLSSSELPTLGVTD